MSANTVPYYRSDRLSRREALRLAAGTGAAGLLAACAPVAPPTPTSAPQPAQKAPATAVPGPASTAPIRITDTGAKLPTEPATFRWIDSGDLKALFYRPFFAAYHEAHPNITIQYDALPWTEINRIVPLGVQNGNAHDAFQLPLNVPPGLAVREGWVAPLDDVIPNFQEWKAAFPFGSFLPGVHTFEGKTYTFPVTSNKRYASLTLYNVEYMQKAGYDPATRPLTWDDLRAAATKVTQQGRGQYFGLILGGQSTERLSEYVRNLGRMAGAPASSGNTSWEDIDWKTGQYNYTADQYLAAIDLLLALKADGSIFPGSLSLDQAQARSRMPQGVAGMILDGPWNIPQWPRENPSFKFGVASTPLPNSGTPIPLTFEENGANQMWVYAKSPYKAIAGDIFAYSGSEDGQTAIVIATQGNLRSMFPRALERARQTQQLDPLATRALELFEEQIRLGPMPELRNPDAVQVALELRPVQPDFGETVQGLLSGQLKDPKQAMQDLKDRSEKELDRAIKAAQQKGAQVSRDDWVFPNWDPFKDYAEEDYAALRKG